MRQALIPNFVKPLNFNFHTCASIFFSRPIARTQSHKSSQAFLPPPGLNTRELSSLFCRLERNLSMADKAAKSMAKVIGEYQFPWREKLSKYRNELSKGVWGYWELGAWKPLGISARHRARIRKEVLMAGEDWPYDPEKKEMRTKRKGHKCDRIAAEKRANTARLMEKMPQMLLDYKKRRWEKKMKEEEKNKQ